MNTIDINGSWPAQKGKLKKRFADLMESDLILEVGKKEELFAKLQLKLGKTKEELDNILTEL